MAATTLNDRYELGRKLGSGGQGSVFAARDRVSERDIAVKLLGASDPADAMRLRAEFARLSTLSHEHVVSVFDLETVQAALDVAGVALTPGQVFFTAELINGPSLQTWAKASPSPDAVLECLDQLASALAHVHRNGVVHCDVKPENILISGDRGAVLFDFGLSLERGDRGLARGTLAFMDGRALAGEPDPQSDLHALGVSMYRSLSGAAPYPHRSPQELASALASRSSAPLSSKCPALPAALCELIDALIDDQRRPRSAIELLERVWSTAEALGLPVRRRVLPRGGGAARLVGRETAVNAICAAIRLDPDRSKPALVQLDAQPFVGAGAVLDEAGRRAQLMAVGRGTSAELLRGAPRAIVDELLRDTAIELDALDGRARLVATADAVIASLASRARDRPVLWLADHAHLSDERLDEVVRALAAGHRGLDDAAATIVGRFDQAMLGDHLTSITIEPLLPGDIEELATNVLGERAPAEWLRELAAQCLGRPQVLRSALAQAALRPEPLRQIDPRELVGDGVAGSIEVFLTGQLSQLPDELTDVLAAMVIADEIETMDRALEWLQSVTGRDAYDLSRALEHLKTAGWLVRSRSGLQAPSSAHARSAESRITTRRRRELHSAALEWLREPTPPQRARHMRVTGPAKAALVATHEAAAHHFARGELVRADRLSRDALERADGAQRSITALLVAQIAFELGEYESAIGHAERAARSRDSHRQRTAQLLAASAKQRAGDLDGATRELTAFLERHPGDHAARGTLAKIHLLRGEYERARELGGTLGTVDRNADGAELCLEAIGLSRLYQGARDDAKQAFEEVRTLATERRDIGLTGRAEALLGLAAHHSGDVAVAADHYRRAAELASQGGQIHAAASAQINRATAEADRGRFISALTALDDALVLLRRIGNIGELSAALYNRAHCLFALGDLTATKATATRSLALAKESGRAQFELYSLLLLGDVARREADLKSARGYYETARDIGERSSAALDTTSVELNLAELCADEGEGSAFDHLERATQTSSGDAARVLLSRARVALVLGEAADGLLDELEPATRRAREQGREDLYWRLSALAGRLASAAGARTRARAHAEAASAELERTLASIPPARHQAMRRDPDIEALTALEAELELSTLRAPLAVSGDSDLRRLLALASRLNSELRLNPLLDQVIDTAIELAGAERGFLLLRSETALDIAVARNIDRQALEEKSDARVSRSIAERAAQSGEVVLALDAAFDERFGGAESVAAMRLRSVLAVPLRFRRELIGTIYVDHRFRAGAFDERAVRLVRELANIAGVAIGNARIAEENRRRAAEITALNKQLESELGARESELAAVRAKLPVGSASASAADEILGSSPAIRKLHELVERMAKAALPVVITGESGSGKELVARALHRLGPRREGPFVAVNCGAVAETLLESELFGHVRGAFTGADRNRRGHFEVADGGTLFLDEIADTSPAMQTKLLRVLQEGELRRLGDEEVRRVDVRVVAATNRELRELVDLGQFREDLFFRLNVLSLRVPPLRDRSSDVGELAEHLLGRTRPDVGAAILSRSALAALSRYSWPGNVRELENELARASALCDGEIDLEHLSSHIRDLRENASDEIIDLDLKARVESLERELIAAALGTCDGNQTRAAKLLGLSRYGLQKKLKRYAI